MQESQHESTQDESPLFSSLLSDLLEDWNTSGEAETVEMEAAAVELAELPAVDEPAPLQANELLRFFDLPVSETPPAVPEPVAEAEVEIEVEIEVELEPEPQPEAEMEPEPEPAPEPELVFEAAAESVPEPEALAEPVVEPEESEPAQAGDGSLARLLASMEEELRRAEQIPLTPQAAAPKSLDRFITFTLAGATYAVDLKHVSETDRIPRVANVPGMPGFLRGAANLRGEILALVDLRLLLNLGPAEHPDAGRMLVVHTQNSGGACGLIVDRLGGMAWMDRAAWHPTPAGPEKATILVSGIGEHRGRLVNVLDLEKLFASDEVRSLTRV